LTGWIAHAGGVEAAVAQLSATLSIGPQESIEAIEAEFFTGMCIAPADWPSFAAAMAEGSNTDRQQSTRFARLSAMAGAERIEPYLSIFFTQQRRLRTNLATRAIQDRYPDLFARLKAEQGRVC